MDLAAKAVNNAVRHLRNEKDPSQFRSRIEHASEVVMKMDDQATKVRMQATKAHKMKLVATKQLEGLSGTLSVISEKADEEYRKTMAGV